MFKTFLYKSYRFFYTSDQRRRRRFTLAGLVLAAIVFITAIVGLDTHSTLVYQVFTLLLSVLLLAWVWSKFLPRIDMAATRELPRYATVGEPLVYRVAFENRTAKKQAALHFYENATDPRPSLDELLSVKEPGEEKRNVWDRNILYYRWLWLISRKQIIEDRLHAVPELPAKGKLKTRVEIVPRSRGYLHFYGIEIARTDPFGLCRALFSVPASQKVIVLPKRYRLPQLTLPGARRHHARGVRQATSIGNYGEFVSLRDYRPGDNMRQIHWKSSAKRNELIVKEHQEEFYARQALILDTFVNSAYSERFEEAVSIAASFVCSLQTQESLLDLMFVGDRTYRFSSGRGTASFDHLLEILAAVQTCRDKAFDAMAPPVFEHMHLFSGCICVLVAWDEARRAFIRNLKNRGVPLLVIVVTEDNPSSPLDPGPMKAFENDFRVVKIGRIEEGLAGL
ncbi:MAG: DUF58 domain-containing protein [Desulfobacterales bacterium]|nr:DUF58 domain-containing protein [Desulfobacterales bacterium]